MSDFMGYSHPQYALSLREFGEPRELPQCGGWVLTRPIPGTPYRDAMGCYPLFACRDWSRLQEDLDHVGSDLISLVLVTDPTSGVTPIDLERCFGLVRPFKTHYVADLSLPLENFVDKDHRYYARKALKTMDVEICCQPGQYIAVWMELYDNLIRKHHIRGISAFSHKSFEIQFGIPGMVMFLGRSKGQIVGADLVLVRGQVAYTHLSAYSQEGYKMSASYGVHWATLVYLREQGIHYYCLGGTAGTQEDPLDGLTHFKKGWSNDRRTAYLCGRIFDKQKYESICLQYQMGDVEYFPAYRAGEFGTHRNASMGED